MKTPKLIFSSTGIKKPEPLPKLNLLVDCRIVVEPGMKTSKPIIAGANSGNNPNFQAWIKGFNPQALDIIESYIEAGISALPYRRANAKDDLGDFTILFFCAHGIHRSVSTKHIMAERFTKKGYEVEVQ